jgi:hypothetical protein
MLGPPSFFNFLTRGQNVLVFSVFAWLTFPALETWMVLYSVKNQLLQEVIDMDMMKPKSVYCLPLSEHQDDNGGYF